MTKPNQTSEASPLYEKVESLFKLRVSSSGADIGIYFKTSKERSGIESIWIDGDEWIEIRQSIEALVKTEVEKARIEMGDDMVALAQPRTFNKWTNKDAADFFVALGAYLKPIVDGEPEKQRLNEREDNHE